MRNMGWKLLYIFSFIILLYIFFQGFPYYTTPIAQRPFTSLHHLFKPGGTIGHGLGIIGSLMMIFMLAYSLRKRIRAFYHWGRLSTWLNVHIYFGIVGPLLVVLHSSFKLNGIVSISFWSMLLVMFSGILGRYLYLKIPRDFSGEELTLQKVQEEARQLIHQLDKDYHIDPQHVSAFLKKYQAKALEDKPLFLLWFHLMLFDLKKVRIYREIRRWLEEAGVAPHQQKALATLIWKRIQLEFELTLWNKIHLLFHYWHVFHKPFAIIMYLIMVVHAGIAIWLGYTWIL